MHRKSVLPNGVRIVTEGMEQVRSVSLGIWVDAGSRDEIAATNGISHFIEHMSFKGTRRRTCLQIAKELDALGGFSNAFTDKENTCFFARVLDRHFSQLVEILADIFLNSLFDPEDMRREKQVILQEIGMVEDTPEENVIVLFEKCLWADHPMGMPVLGTNESVMGLDPEALRRHVKATYVPERVLIAAAGCVEHEAVVSLFAPLFEGMGSTGLGPGFRDPVPRVRRGRHLTPKDLEQVHICLGGEAPSYRDARRYASVVLNTILGGNMSSRLFQEIRERQGLAYAIHSFGSSYLDTGIFGIYAATDPRNIERVLSSIQREIRRIQNGGISPAELQAAKEHLVGGAYLAAEGSESRMMRLARNEFVHGRHVPFEEMVTCLEGVTLEDVTTLSRDIFRDDGTTLVVLGPVEEKDWDPEGVTLS